MVALEAVYAAASVHSGALRALFDGVLLVAACPPRNLRGRTAVQECSLRFLPGMACNQGGENRLLSMRFAGRV